MNQPETVKLEQRHLDALSNAVFRFKFNNTLKEIAPLIRALQAENQALSAKLSTMQERIETLEALLYPPNPYEGDTITAVSSSSGEGATFEVTTAKLGGAECEFANHCYATHYKKTIDDLHMKLGVLINQTPSAVREPLSDVCAWLMRLADSVELSARGGLGLSFAATQAEAYRNAAKILKEHPEVIEQHGIKPTQGEK